MKARHEFVLPIPPIDVHIIHACMRDNDEADGRGKKGSKAVDFHLPGYGGDRGITPVGGSALANHIRNMRALRGTSGRNISGKNFPHFNMHLIRSTMGDCILDETDLPPGTASLVIGNEIPADGKRNWIALVRLENAGTLKHSVYQRNRRPCRLDRKRC